MEQKLVMTAPNTPTTNIKSTFKRVGLIDADFIKYLVCSDISNYIKRNGHHPNEKYGVSYLDVFVNDQMKKQFHDRFDSKGNIYFFSGSSSETFRAKLAITKEYKGNRGLSEPDYDGFYSDLASVISIISKEHTVYIHPNYEADDLVSILQNENTFIYSRDKDLKQVPGHHYNISKNSLEYIEEKDAHYSLWMQLLQGDSTDNIVGVENVGEKTAKKLLEQISTNNLHKKVIEVYTNKYGIIEGLDRFAETWMLVKMRISRGGYEADKLKAAFYLRDTLINSK
tara:strand:+ start:20476 stop:21324 length:849 start_codon:yes stop_codon:yes gene_type:complete